MAKTLNNGQLNKYTNQVDLETFKKKSEYIKTSNKPINRVIDADLKVFFGSVNQGKISRFRRIAQNLGINFITPFDLSYELKVPAEKGVDVLENAEIKAKFYWDNLEEKMPVISEDVGLNFFGLSDDLSPGKDLKRVVKNSLGSSNSANMVSFYADLAASNGGKIECDWEFAYSLYDGDAFYNSELFQKARLTHVKFSQNSTDIKTEHDLDSLIMVQIGSVFKPYINLTEGERKLYWENPIQSCIIKIIDNFRLKRPSMVPQKILYASGNVQKIAEFKYMVASPKYCILTLEDINEKIIKFEDVSTDLQQNSVAKAEYYWQALQQKMPVIVQDNQIELRQVQERDKIVGTLENHLQQKFGRKLNDREIADYFHEICIRYQRPVEFAKIFHYTIYTGTRSFGVNAECKAFLTDDFRQPVASGSPLESLMSIEVKSGDSKHIQDCDDREKFHWYSSQRIAIQKMLNIVRPGKPKVLFATTNGHKIALFKISWRKQALDKYFQLLTLNDIPDLRIGHIEENTETFAGDALLKAKKYAQISGLPTISQDRGFTFEALNWPGTKTKEVLAGSESRVLLEQNLKFEFEKSTDSAKVSDWNRTSQALDKLKDDNRKVFITQGLAIALPDGQFTSEEHITTGIASERMRNGIGWFFDWFFIPDGYDKTFSEFKAEDLVKYQTEILYPITPKIVEFLYQEVKAEAQLNQTPLILIHGGSSFKNEQELNDWRQESPEEVEYTEKFVEQVKTGEYGWYKNLAGRLSEVGYAVFAPIMPDFVNAKYLDWKATFEKLLSNLNSSPILIGHSLGGLFLAQYLSEIQLEKRVKALHLVSVSGNLGDFGFQQGWDTICQNCEDIYLWHSKDDPVVPFSVASHYHKNLPKSILVSFDGRGHLGEGQASFPELLSFICNRTMQL